MATESAASERADPKSFAGKLVRVAWRANQVERAVTSPGRYAKQRAKSKAMSSGQRYESEAVLKVFFGENGSREDMLASIRALREDATAAVGRWQEIADLYEAGEGAHPDRFALSALVARLLGEQQAATARWAAWAETRVSAWDESSAGDVDWGVATIRATGEPFQADGEQ